ncbi:hypothetical protein RP20_CCG026115 [Aedes albopictus]|nr:hypothetical protein RP20_CCG026115 [Aedes albopictus]
MARDLAGKLNLIEIFLTTNRLQLNKKKHGINRWRHLYNWNVTEKPRGTGENPPIIWDIQSHQSGH